MLLPPRLFLSLLSFLNTIAAVEFTNSDYDGITAGKPFTITWRGDETPVNITLLNGDPTNLQRVDTLALSETGNSFTFTPPVSPAKPGLFALQIAQSGQLNYSPRFLISDAPAAPQPGLPVPNETPTSGVGAVPATLSAVPVPGTPTIPVSPASKTPDPAAAAGASSGGAVPQTTGAAGEGGGDGAGVPLSPASGGYYPAGNRTANGTWVAYNSTASGSLSAWLSMYTISREHCGGEPGCVESFTGAAGRVRPLRGVGGAVVGVMLAGLGMGWVVAW